MREIKFRAWNKDKQEFEYFVFAGNGRYTHSKLEAYSTNAIKDWSEYAGLHDAFGEEIYEGDILDGYGGLFECYWDEDGSWEFKWHKTPRVGSIKPTDMRVFANIYQNPNLVGQPDSRLYATEARRKYEKIE